MTMTSSFMSALPAEGEAAGSITVSSWLMTVSFCVVLARSDHCLQSLVWGDFCQGAGSGRFISLFVRRTTMSSSRPRERSGHRFCVGSPVAGRGRHGVDTEGSSPAGATDRARVLVFGGPCDPDHDAIMRIEGEAPGRRFHSSRR